MSELSSIFRNYGTHSISDLLEVTFGSEYVKYASAASSSSGTEWDDKKYEVLKIYFHPIYFKILPWKNERKSATSDKLIQKNRIVEDFVIVEKSMNLDCFDLARMNKNFASRVFGIKVAVHNYVEQKTLIINGLVDNVLLDCISCEHVTNRISNLWKNVPKDPEFMAESFTKYIKSLSLKDILVFSNDELYSRYLSTVSVIQLMKQKQTSQLVKEFINTDLFSQRSMLIQLLLKSNEHEYKYLSYLLYDMLSNETNPQVESNEQTALFNSLPWNMKLYFKDAMKQTVSYTNAISKYDSGNIPLEQQICLLKTTDAVKEKAMVKLREIKSKSDDTTTKARQYLDGLLKIPFGAFSREKILDEIAAVKEIYSQMQVRSRNIFCEDHDEESEEKTEKATVLEIKNSCIKINNRIDEIASKYLNKFIIGLISSNKKDVLLSVLTKVTMFIKKNKLNIVVVAMSGKTIEQIRTSIECCVTNVFEIALMSLKKYKKGEGEDCVLQKCDVFFKELVGEYCFDKKCGSPISLMRDLINDSSKMEKIMSGVSDYVTNVSATLDSAVHGHVQAKRQIERIVGQWISGESTGYCFGFEGPPGVGKCFAKNTPIMLSNGEIKMVQDITINDKLMGDDSRERNVLALGNGKEKMYRIEQVKGDNYIVNESHILSLKMSKSGKKGYKHQTILGKRYLKDEIIDICIKDYLNLPEYIKGCLKGYKVGVEFIESYVSLEPYALGCWLGDGTSRNFGITTIDEPIINYFREFAKKYDLEIKQGKGNNEITYSITTGKMGGRSDKNILMNKLKEYNLINNKHIPSKYKCNSREVRLQLLAGLIDTDGYYNEDNNSLEIAQKNKKLAEDILWIVRSLGFRGIMKECTKSCTYKGEKRCGQYYRTIITGKGLQDIPTLLERKKPREHNQIKDCLNTGIKVIPLEEDEYFGFQIDGNSRFLLGDFTVTHNTSLAKYGLANCLKNENGESRPFAFIAMGGSSNGSTLEGHNYTYVGSMWGKIVDILMDKKCMNPIIFIDELDKISNTDHGREIVGILTHLIDSTQNDCFQDKYFNGIDLDLSKALFIFSYNDPGAVDKILLDRIHRIKFKHITLDEKLVICKNYLLPELYKKMGLENGVVELSEDNLKFIIEKYTCEPGVRKLKELLFEIIGDINLKCIKMKTSDHDDSHDDACVSLALSLPIPITITNEEIKMKYLRERHEVRVQQISASSKVGIINGLWANAVGRGGIIPIEAHFFPCDRFFDLKLTGMQGDVMKESMNVAKTLAWSLLTEDEMTRNLEMFTKMKMQGIHIHCPEGATPKDGPSAGTAITCVLYSLLTNKKIDNRIAITGEINLQGHVTAIGGLDLKIMGGINGGVTTFIFPKDNKKDYDEFMEKNGTKEEVKSIVFIQVSSIQEVLGMIFC
jgi:ATP-dependent Lon protease